ncbi:multidrug transporter [Comamonas serinivorans]|uniref:Multidrug transporter n=1 Tax=Comamonas serinivorans TaxID=1082851 RepID=A0A1Y0EPS7_9BURK|nr:efflux transporter outer membrane subunit [Comamonas serinivorans]ARU05488.1 multidrug transporter [Comamonas serinivorans]
MTTDSLVHPNRAGAPAPGRWSVVLVPLLLAGCMTDPQLPPPHLDTPTAALQARAATVAAQPALDASAPPSPWWRLFNDATLTALEGEAGTRNLDLRAAVARIDESRAQLGLVSANRAPQLAATAGYTRSGLSEHSPLHRLGAPTAGSSTWTLGLQAGWELDLWGHLRQVETSARMQLQAVAYGQEAVRVSVAAEVARTYLLLRGAQAQTAIAQDNQRIAQDLLRMAESRARNGVATRFDAAAARADLAGIEASLLQLQHQRDTLMNALALLLGWPPRELNDRLVDAALPAMPARLPVGVSSELARTRPDILQANARLQAAVADIGAARADFYPRIGLGGSLGVQAFQLSDLGSWASRQFSVGPTLHLPIFQGGRLQSQLALSEARHQLAAIAYQQTVLRAWHEVDDALGAYASERAREVKLREAQQQSQVALDVAQKGYQEGVSDFTAVLVARRSLLSSQAALADCATASALSVVGLYRALGGGWSPELLQPDAAQAGSPQAVPAAEPDVRS